MTQSTLLRSKVGLALVGVSQDMRRIREHPHLGALFPHYLATAHSITRATVDMLELACTRAKELAPSDRLSASMVDYLGAHAVEERHHDDWLLGDLQAMGTSAAKLYSLIPDSHVAALVGSQLYWIGYAHPVSIFGYMMVLEGFAATPDQVEHMVSRSGRPRRHFKSLIRHSRLDEHHAAELDAAIDALELDARGSAILGQSAFATVKHEAAVWRSLCDRFDHEMRMTDARDSSGEPNRGNQKAAR